MRADGLDTRGPGVVLGQDLPRGHHSICGVCAVMSARTICPLEVLVWSACGLVIASRGSGCKAPTIERKGTHVLY